MTKIARGHAVYDLADPQYGVPTTVTWFTTDPAMPESADPFPPLARRARELPQLLPEVGSRGLQRLFSDESMDGEWLTVQPTRYRYSLHVSERLVIRFVLRGYFACEVAW